MNKKEKKEKTTTTKNAYFVLFSALELGCYLGWKEFYVATEEKALGGKRVPGASPDGTSFRLSLLALSTIAQDIQSHL